MPPAHSERGRSYAPRGGRVNSCWKRAPKPLQGLFQRDHVGQSLGMFAPCFCITLGGWGRASSVRSPCQSGNWHYRGITQSLGQTLRVLARRFSPPRTTPFAHKPTQRRDPTQSLDWRVADKDARRKLPRPYLFHSRFDSALAFPGSNFCWNQEALSPLLCPPQRGCRGTRQGHDLILTPSQ